MEGLVEEGKEVIDEDGDPAVIDAALIACAQRVEHYEMAGYGCVRTFAKLLGYEDAAALLQETLDEEGEADKTLTELAETVINVRRPRRRTSGWSSRAERATPDHSDGPDRRRRSLASLGMTTARGAFAPAPPGISLRRSRPVSLSEIHPPLAREGPGERALDECPGTKQRHDFRQRRHADDVRPRLRLRPAHVAPDGAGVRADTYRLVLFDHVGAGQSDLRRYDRSKYGSLAGLCRRRRSRSAPRST